MDLESVISLFESKHTALLSDRQAKSIIQLSKEMVNDDQQIGFYYRELPKVARLLELVHDRLMKKNVSIGSYSLYALV